MIGSFDNTAMNRSRMISGRKRNDESRLSRRAVDGIMCPKQLARGEIRGRESLIRNEQRDRSGYAMMSTTRTINDLRHGGDAGADTYYAYNTLNQLTVKGDDAGFANPTYYHYDANGSLIKPRSAGFHPAATKSCPRVWPIRSMGR